MAYLLDANVLIAANSLHYGMDFCPAFWDWAVAANGRQKVFSVESVADEIDAGDDDLCQWAAERGAGFFLQPDSSVLPAFERVSEWATSGHYDQSAVNTFLQVADYYLVAQALAGQHTVVTHEVASGSRRKIKIPDACIGLGVKCMNPFTMLRKERARFVLGGSA